MGIIVAAAGLALVVNLAATPIIIRVAQARGWYDLPNGRKIHTEPIPRLGGLGIFLGLAAVAILIIVRPSYAMGWQGLLVLAAFLFIHALGLLDDFRNLHASIKFSLELVAAALVVVAGFSIDRVGLPGIGGLSLGWLAWPVTLLWIVGLSNAMNLVDGVDGFAGAIALTAALAFSGTALLQGRSFAALLGAGLVGAVGGFLAYNFPPARIFMGDSGALLLGFLLATLPLLRDGRAMTPEAFTLELGGTVTVLALPVLDTATAILRRLRRRVPIYAPDKLHLHHKLLALGLGDRAIFVVGCLAGLLLAACALAAQWLGGWAGFGVLAGVWVAIVAGYTWLRRAARATGQLDLAATGAHPVPPRP